MTDMPICPSCGMALLNYKQGPTGMVKSCKNGHLFEPDDSAQEWGGAIRPVVAPRPPRDPVPPAIERRLVAGCAFAGVVAAAVFELVGRMVGVL